MGQIILEKISTGKCYAIDTMIIVYFLETHPAYFSTAKKLFERIEGGEIQAVLSSLVFAELLVPAYRIGEFKRAESIFRLLSNFPNIQVVSVTPEISMQAAKLRASYGMRTPDAIHAATAIIEKVDGIITNDREFLKIRKTIEVFPFEHVMGDAYD